MIGQKENKVKSKNLKKISSTLKSFTEKEKTKTVQKNHLVRNLLQSSIFLTFIGHIKKKIKNLKKKSKYDILWHCQKTQFDLGIKIPFFNRNSEMD